MSGSSSLNGNSELSNKSSFYEAPTVKKILSKSKLLVEPILSTLKHLPDFLQTSKGSGGVINFLIDRLEGLEKYGKKTRSELKAEINSLKSLTRKLEDKISFKIGLQKESRHRFKNDLQSIISLMNCRKRKSSNEQQNVVLNQTISLLRSVLNVHDNLNLPKDEAPIRFGFSQYLRRFLPILVEIFVQDSDSVDLKLNIQDSELTNDNYLPMGLIINELAMNSIEHGKENGNKMTLKVDYSEDKGLGVLKVSDNGKGLPDEGDFPENSRGMEIVRTLVEKQLKGALKDKSNGEGCEWYVQFPLVE